MREGNLATFGPVATAEDVPRIKGQMKQVLDWYLSRTVSLYGGWRTVEEACEALQDICQVKFPAQSVEAQLRHLRKARFGAYRVTRRKRAGKNVSEYKIEPPAPTGQTTLF